MMIPQGATQGRLYPHLYCGCHQMAASHRHYRMEQTRFRKDYWILLLVLEVAGWDEYY